MDGGFVPHSAADWQAAVPELTREGSELVGPCPMPDCGGEDRFHVNHEGVIGCRGCIDGRPEGERKRRFGEIVRHVFGEPERRQMNGSALPTRTYTYCKPDGSPGSATPPWHGAAARMRYCAPAGRRWEAPT